MQNIFNGGGYMKVKFHPDTSNDRIIQPEYQPFADDGKLKHIHLYPDSKSPS